MIVGGPSQQVHAVERPLQQIERLAENLLRQFLDRFRPRLRRRTVRGSATMLVPLAADHLQRRALCPAERRCARPPAGRATRWSATSASSGVILPRTSMRQQMWFAGIRHRHRRRLPQLALGKGERLEAELPHSPAIVFKSARLSPDMVSARLASARLLSDRELRPAAASAPSRRSMSSSDNASRSTSSVTDGFHRSRGRRRRRSCGLATHVAGDERRRSGRWCARASGWSVARPRRWPLRASSRFRRPSANRVRDRSAAGRRAGCPA